jgi:hypothetical protein
VSSGSVAPLLRGVRRWFTSLCGDPIAPRRLALELAFAVAALSLAGPLFVTGYVPIQDLPQHVAAVRVLHDFHSPLFGFERWFEVHWASTQYVAVYFAAHLLAYLIGPVVATKTVLGASLVALPYALRALLQSLHRPVSYALLVVPLVYNTQLVLGFLNFVMGLPLMLFGLALFVRYREQPTRARLIALSVVATLCFLSHVVPYGMLLLAALALSERRQLLRGALPFAPSLLLASAWSASTPAGRAFSTLSTSGALFASREPLASRIAEASFWLNDVLWTHEDEHALVGTIALVGIVVVAGAVVRFRHRSERNLAPRLRWFALLAPLCALLYLTLPSSYGFIWPIHARFVVLAGLFAIPLLPPTPPGVRSAVAAAALALSLYVIHAVGRAFAESAELEYAGLAHVIDRIPYGSRTAGLIYDPGSRFVRFSPFLHAVAWVQAERGGAVMFTFADFPASPFTFREDNRPPRVPPRWEWLPTRVAPARDLGFYEYVLTRAAPEPLRGFRRTASDGAWALWQR